MADPSSYGQSFNFSGYQEANPSSPLPGARLDVELADVQDSTVSLVAAVKDIRRSDGKLKNGIVGPDALSSTLSVGFTLRGAWASGVDYNAGDGVVLSNSFYKARVQHTSASASSPDIDSDTWAFLFTFTSITITDGSITAAKLDESDAANFLTALGIDDQGALVAAALSDATGKAVPVDADVLALMDSADTDSFKGLTWANLKATLFSAWGTLLSAGTAKTAPADADVMLLSDSADNHSTKKLSWTNLKAALKSYFDDVYAVRADYQPLKTILTSLSGLSVVAGDLLYGSGTAALSRLAKGNDGQYLTLSSGLPAWGNALGVGQAWVNETSSRSASNVYRNTTGAPIFLAISVIGQDSGPQLQISSDNVTYISIASVPSHNTGACTLTGIVPTGYYYKINGSVEISVWAELR